MLVTILSSETSLAVQRAPVQNAANASVLLSMPQTNSSANCRECKSKAQVMINAKEKAEKRPTSSHSLHTPRTIAPATPNRDPILLLSVVELRPGPLEPI